MTEAMAVYGMVFAKLAIGLLAIILQINLMGKGNLAPTSALDQLQNYVLGGIIGAIIYNDQIGILQFMLVLILWTILVMTLKFLKGNLRIFKAILDGHPVIVIEKGHILTEECMRYGIQAAELKLKLRAAGVQYVTDVKRAVLEQNGQLNVVQFGEDNIRFDLIDDGQINQFTLDVIEKDRDWLEQEIQAQGYSVKDIYIAEYKDGKVVILDEPTAALDALAEDRMYREFENMIYGKTAVFISHRLGSTRFCDKIAMFEDGTIVEEGTHEELMAKNGKYAYMFGIQSQYYDEKQKNSDNVEDADLEINEGVEALKVEMEGGQ